MSLRITLTGDPLTRKPITLPEPHQEGLEPPEFPTHDATLAIHNRTDATLRVLAAGALHWHGDSLPLAQRQAVEAVLDGGVRAALTDAEGADILAWSEPILEFLIEFSTPGYNPQSATDSIMFVGRLLLVLVEWARHYPEGRWLVETHREVDRRTVIEDLLEGWVRP